MTKGISFIIVAYNEEKYIGDCLDSIHNAIRSPLVNVDSEIIVVDNNSTDNTAHIALENGAAVVGCQKQGVAAAREAGYRASKYDILVFLDADSRIPNREWLHIMWTNLTSFRQWPDLVVATSGPWQFYDMPKWVNPAIRYVFYPATRLLHIFCPTMQGGNFAVKRKALDKVGGFDTSYTFWGEDSSIAVKLSKVGRILLDPEMYMLTSGRRMKKDGMVTTTFKYIVNHIATTVYKKPINHDYNNIR